MTLLIVEDQSAFADLEDQPLLMILCRQLDLKHLVRLQAFVACFAMEEVVETQMSAFYFDTCY